MLRCRIPNEGSRKVPRDDDHDNLHIILADGFKTNSGKAIAFGKTAIDVLKTYIVAG